MSNIVVQFYATFYNLKTLILIKLRNFYRGNKNLYS